jgi:hypothetical protein
MFYDVRILNAKGKLKKTLSAQELSRRYWKNIREQESGLNPGTSKVRRLSSEMRRKLDVLFPRTLSY